MIKIILSNVNAIRQFGYPFVPKITKPANCGPTALAAYMRCSTNDAIKMLDKHHKSGKWPGFTNVNHIRGALSDEKISFKLVKEIERDSIIHTWGRTFFAFIQIKGKWSESKYWRASYNHTHWMLLDHGRIFDVCNYDGEKHIWIDPGEWAGVVMPWLVEDQGGTGWGVKSAYEPIPICW